MVRSYVIAPAVTNYQPPPPPPPPPPPTTTTTTSSTTVVVLSGYPQLPQQQVVMYQQEKISDTCILGFVGIIGVFLLFCLIMFFMAIPLCVKAKSFDCPTVCPGLWFPYVFALYLVSVVGMINLCKKKSSKIVAFVSLRI